MAAAAAEIAAVIGRGQRWEGRERRERERRRRPDAG